ncbi:hypothetical protein [Methanimicrococcus hongohii]|nr:hypothetical protein [Methanimicrococcus sp. Hf6]
MGFHIMNNSLFYFYLYAAVGTPLFSFIVFLILGYLGGASGAVYHTGQGKVPFFSWKVTSNHLIAGVLLSGILFVIGTLPFWMKVF